MSAHSVEAPRVGASRTGSRATAAVLGLAAVGAWAGLLALGDMEMGGGGLGEALAFEGAWLLMMTAMMLPSVAPFVLLLRRTARQRPGEAAGLAVAGYLSVWSATGGLALAANALLDPTPTVIAAILIAAGAYQLTPLKAWCLTRCRSPLGFLMQHWRNGRRSDPLRLGARHGVHCVGCCWALMLVLVGAVGMGVGWVALVAAVVLVEKVVPGGERLMRPLGVALVAVGVAVLMDPGLAGLGEAGREMKTNHTM